MMSACSSVHDAASAPWSPLRTWMSSTGCAAARRARKCRRLCSRGPQAVFQGHDPVLRPVHHEQRCQCAVRHDPPGGVGLLDQVGDRGEVHSSEQPPLGAARALMVAGRGFLVSDGQVAGAVEGKVGRDRPWLLGSLVEQAQSLSCMGHERNVAAGRVAGQGYPCRVDAEPLVMLDQPSSGGSSILDLRRERGHRAGPVLDECDDVAAVGETDPEVHRGSHVLRAPPRALDEDDAGQALGHHLIPGGVGQVEAGLDDVDVEIDPRPRGVGHVEVNVDMPLAGQGIDGP